jgi:hypothetical protein
MSQYGMKENKMILRRSKPTDIESIIELLAQLDRPLPTDRYKNKNSRNSKVILSKLY